MIKCKYDENRIVYISTNKNELFININTEYFFICQILSGYAVLLINGEKFHLTSNMLLSFPRNTKIELLTSYNLQALSVSFAPEFINTNLNWKLIESKDYPLLSKDFGYPCFDLFFQRNILYDGILPLDKTLSENIFHLLSEIINQVDEQSDKMWSCRSRSTIFSLLNIAEHFCHDFMKGDSCESSLESKILNYIHLNLCKPLSIEMLCDLFYTNHTTICRKFKALTGFSITDYIIEKRLLLAKHSLAFTFLPISEIAKKYGFNDVSYFIRVFNKRVGLTPTKYRNTMQKNRKIKIREE